MKKEHVWLWLARCIPRKLAYWVVLDRAAWVTVYPMRDMTPTEISLGDFLQVLTDERNGKL